MGSLHVGATVQATIVFQITFHRQSLFMDVNTKNALFKQKELDTLLGV